MSESSDHYPFDLPILVLGGGSGQPGWRHIKYPDGTQLASLGVTLLDKLGVHVDAIGNSGRSRWKRRRFNTAPPPVSRTLPMKWNQSMERTANRRDPHRLFPTVTEPQLSPSVERPTAV
jgi:hypothetical protein